MTIIMNCWMVILMDFWQIIKMLSNNSCGNRSCPMCQAIPGMYRILFKRDIFKDLTKLEKAYGDKTAQFRTGNDDSVVYAQVCWGRYQYCRSRPPDYRIRTRYVDWKRKWWFLCRSYGLSCQSGWHGSVLIVKSALCLLE